MALKEMEREQSEERYSEDEGGGSEALGENDIGSRRGGRFRRLEHEIAEHER